MKTLDLHGYKSDDVFDAVEKFISSQLERNAPKAKIMTGKGKGIVKNLVIDYLKKANYPWHYEKNKRKDINEGVIIVVLD